MILVLIAVIHGSKVEITTCIYKNENRFDDASSIGFKMYSNNKLQYRKKNISTEIGTKVLNQSIVKNYKRNFQHRQQQVMLV